MPALHLAVLAGPTAIGKTAVAIALAEHLDAEIVCADSRTVYRGMDIGTAKPTAEERERVPHHLLDIASPDEIVTLVMYQHLAGAAIAAIRSRGRVPLLVGGTGLYIKAVVDDLRIPPAEPDWSLRAALEAEERAGGPGTLHRRLATIDPVAASRIHARNLRRIIRALEIHAKTGLPMSVLHGSAGAPTGGRGSPCVVANGDVLMVALTTDRAKLYDRIHRRIDHHLSAGLIDEVRRLLAAGYAPALPAMQALGYKETVPYVMGRCSLEESRALLRRNTCRYAKRQLTWFRADARYRWVEVGDESPGAVADRIRTLFAGTPDP